MAKLPRIAQKIFCGNAQPTETAVFGTMKTSTPQYTGDVKTLMSSAAYGQGWSSAVEENFAPFLEELNGVQKGLSQQTGYILQEGIPEYDSETTYYKGSVVKVTGGLNENNYVLYRCLNNGAVGIPVTDEGSWKVVYDTAKGIQNLDNMEQTVSTSTIKYPSSAAVYNATQSAGNPTGTIIAWSTSTAPAGYLICDGSAVSRTTYAALFAVIGTTYGAGDGNSTFNLPNSYIHYGKQKGYYKKEVYGKYGGNEDTCLWAATTEGNYKTQFRYDTGNYGILQGTRRKTITADFDTNQYIGMDSFVSCIKY